jgi:uncharacterized spore protein YtfJ
MGGRTDFGFGSAPDESERFGLSSSMSETDSGFGGGAIAGAGAGVTSAAFALLMGGTADLTEVRVSAGGFLLLGEIRSVAD